ncbi:MAG: aminotransferase class III-fold pyridoxal phosphate-dependent enzyme [Oscillospiraceae bacterium]|nr:aminotransferase class III-fold pyridoxal phosphate-dependent enzyme [Oscillospiraceae bacterium]
MYDPSSLTGISKGGTIPAVAGEGIRLYDSEGKTYYDLSEISNVLGQKNAHFTKRLTEKLSGLVGGKIAGSPEKRKFYQYLAKTTGNRYSYVHLTSSGSEASEWAVRMALKMTGRNEVLAFWNSIHGRTYLSASLSGMPRRKQGYAPSAPGVLYGAYPDCAHCPFEKSCESCGFFCLKFLDQKMKYESSREIGAVIVEAYQGAGIIVPPKGWLKALQDWAHSHGALFILDEIQSGMGRTGKMYCFEAEGLEPDMLLLGKALGNGFPIGAALLKQVPDAFYQSALLGGAGDTELAYAAGCAVFEELLEHGLLEYIAQVSTYLEEKLTQLQRQCAPIKNICCKGLAVSIEFDNPETFASVLAKTKEAGLILGTGENNKLVLRPPYVITKADIDEITSVLQQSIHSCM